MVSELAQSHFELFGLLPSFDVDQQLLAGRYRELQRSIHPDRFANASERERRMAVQRAAQINEAFDCLKEPLKRARYLLELNGIPVDDERDTHVDAEFLMEQMGLREALGEVRDAPEPLRELAGLMVDIERRRQEINAELAAQFATGRVDQLSAAKANVHKLQFLRKLYQEAQDLEEELIDAV